MTRLEPSPALIVATLLFALEREDHATKSDPNGANWCRTHRVGRIRARLGPPSPDNVWPITGHASEGARRDAVQFLESHCRACGLCALGKE